MNSDPARKKREGRVPLDRPDRHVTPPVFVPEAPGHHMQIAGLVRKRTKSHVAGPVCMMPDAVRSPQELSRSRYHRSRVSGISPALSMSDGRTDRKAASGTGYRSAGLDRGGAWRVPDSGHVLPFFACPDCRSAKNGNPAATASDGAYPETMRNPRFSWRIPAVFPEECGIIDRPALKNGGRKNEKRIHAAGIRISPRYRLYCRSSADLLW